MNCILYARISTEKQADKELSIPAQLEAMRDYARRRDWQVVSEFIEPGASAKTAARPELQKLLSLVRDSDPRVDVVLVHKIDRLTRNVYDHATIRALLKQHGIRLASVVENVDESVSGELVENIMASITQFYSANLSEEVTKGMRQKVLNGGWPHLAPSGYVQVRPSGDATSRIEIHPRLGRLITRCFELYASGRYSPKRLVAILAGGGLTTKTGTPLSPAHLHQILRNPFYTGRICWNGLDVAGSHQALVTSEVFDKVQRLLKERSRHRGRKGSLAGVPLRGIAICAACRGHMAAERQDRWLYYRCSRQAYKRELCPARFCNAERAHADLRRICLQIQITRESARAIGKAVRRRLEAHMITATKHADDVEKKTHELLAAGIQVTESFAQGRLSATEYASATEHLLRQRNELAQSQKRSQTNSREFVHQVEHVLQLATSLWDVYEPLPDRKRTDLLRLVFSTIAMNSDGIVGFSLTDPFKTLQTRGDAEVDKVAEQLMEVLDNAA